MIIGDRTPEGNAILADWRAAGFPLGSHSWTHMSLNENSAAASAQHAEQNEAVLKPFMAGAD